MYISLMMLKIVLDGDFTSSTVEKYLDHRYNGTSGESRGTERFAFFTLESI